MFFIQYDHNTRKMNYEMQRILFIHDVGFGMLNFMKAIDVLWLQLLQIQRFTFLIVFFVWHYARSSDTRYVDKWEFSDSTCCHLLYIHFLFVLTIRCFLLNKYKEY